jgi:hypothetical protein
MTLSLRRAGRHTRTTPVAHVGLSRAAWRTITVRLSLRPGDRVSAMTAAVRSNHLPSLHAAITTSRRSLRVAARANGR